jgi:hypothetical protein
MNTFFGRGYPAGLRRGRGAAAGGYAGGGRGWRNRFFATGAPGWMPFGGYAAPFGYQAPYQKPDPESEKQALRGQADALQSELDYINKRLSELESRSPAE